MTIITCTKVGFTTQLLYKCPLFQLCVPNKLATEYLVNSPARTKNTTITTTKLHKHRVVVKNLLIYLYIYLYMYTFTYLFSCKDKKHIVKFIVSHWWHNRDPTLRSPM